MAHDQRCPIRQRAESAAFGAARAAARGRRGEARARGLAHRAGQDAAARVPAQGARLGRAEEQDHADAQADERDHQEVRRHRARRAPSRSKCARSACSSSAIPPSWQRPRAPRKCRQQPRRHRRPPRHRRPLHRRSARRNSRRAQQEARRHEQLSEIQAAELREKQERERREAEQKVAAREAQAAIEKAQAQAPAGAAVDGTLHAPKAGEAKVDKKAKKAKPTTIMRDDSARRRTIKTRGDMGGGVAGWHAPGRFTPPRRRADGGAADRSPSRPSRWRARSRSRRPSPWAISRTGCRSRRSR